MLNMKTKQQKQGKNKTSDDDQLVLPTVCIKSNIEQLIIKLTWAWRLTCSAAAVFPEA